ncbi:GDP-mannose 4,6-dehydratase [Alphaproteobacteria bacterium LSUCC0719]
MSKILVTGAGGFIGSHLVEKLVNDGHDVKAMTHYRSDGGLGWLDDIPYDVFKEIEISKGDIVDFSFINQVAKGCELIINMAALIGIPYSYTAPQSYVNTNVLGCSNILNAALNNNVGRVIQISTSEVFGSALIRPMNEDHPKNAQSPYAATKTAADQLSLSFYRSFGLPVTIIRPFNTFGPRQSLRAVIPTIAAQMINDNGKIELGNVHTTRDFSYVDDTVEGIALAVTAGKMIDGHEINLGTGIEYSIKEIVDLFCLIKGKEVFIVTKEERLRPGKSEVLQLISDNSKAKQLLGWSPKYSNPQKFKESLKTVADWVEKQSYHSSKQHYAT